MGNECCCCHLNIVDAASKKEEDHEDEHWGEVHVIREQPQPSRETHRERTDSSDDERHAEHHAHNGEHIEPRPTALNERLVDEPIDNTHRHRKHDDNNYEHHRHSHVSHGSSHGSSYKGRPDRPPVYEEPPIKVTTLEETTETQQYDMVVEEELVREDDIETMPYTPTKPPVDEHEHFYQPEPFPRTELIDSADNAASTQQQYDEVTEMEEIAEEHHHHQHEPQRYQPYEEVEIMSQQQNFDPYEQVKEEDVISSSSSEESVRERQPEIIIHSEFYQPDLPTIPLVIERVEIEVQDHELEPEPVPQPVFSFDPYGQAKEEDLISLSSSSTEEEEVKRPIVEEIFIHSEFYHHDLEFTPLGLLIEKRAQPVEVAVDQLIDIGDTEGGKKRRRELLESLEALEPILRPTKHNSFAVIYEHIARNDGELTVHFLNEVQALYEKPQATQWECRKLDTDNIGYVPVECLTPTFLHNNWFHNFQNRAQVEAAMRNRPVGTYVIRPSDKTIFVLSLKAENEITRHYGINHVKGLHGGFHIDGDSKKFKTLHDLVANFTENRELFPCDLKYPLGSELEEDYAEHLPEIHTFRHSVTQEVIAQQDYRAEQDGEISVRAGEPLVINGGSHNQFQVESLWTGLKGSIPAYILTGTTDRQPWYAGDRSRIEVEKELMEPLNDNGSFAVRLQNGDRYELMVRNQYTIKHYLISEDEKGQFVFHADGRAYPALASLVDSYYERKYSQSESGEPSLQLAHHYKKHEEIDLGIYDISMSREIRPEFLQNLQHVQTGRIYEIYSATLVGRYGKNIDVVVKQCKNDVYEPMLKEELDIVGRLNNENIVYLRAWITNSQPNQLIYDSMNRNLIKHVQTQPGAYQIVIDIAAQIANGLVYLEEEGIIHGNLQGKHIFVSDRGPFCPIVKIGGFRRAMCLPPGESEVIGDVNLSLQCEYAAPEVIKDRLYSTKSDIWSYGVVIYEILTRGERLYPNIKDKNILYRFLEEGNRLPKPEYPDEIVYETIQKCWAFNANQRPSASDIFEIFDNQFAYERTL